MVVPVSKFVVNLRKVSNRTHPYFFPVHPVSPTHQPLQPQRCLYPDKEVNCNYQSLSPLKPVLRLSILSPLSSLLPTLHRSLSSPYRPATWKFHPPVIISPPPTLPHSRGRRLRRSKESTWRDEGRPSIFRYVANFVKCYCSIYINESIPAKDKSDPLETNFDTNRGP